MTDQTIRIPLSKTLQAILALASSLIPTSAITVIVSPLGGDESYYVSNLCKRDMIVQLDETSGSVADEMETDDEPG